MLVIPGFIEIKGAFPNSSEGSVRGVAIACIKMLLSNNKYSNKAKFFYEVVRQVKSRMPDAADQNVKNFLSELNRRGILLYPEGTNLNEKYKE